jgi:hypothetical protein
MLRPCAFALPLASLAFNIAMASPAAASPPNYPFPQHVQYAPGTLRPNDRTQAQQDQDVRDKYGNWKSLYLVQAPPDPAGNARYRIQDPLRNGVTVSEGQGYGMVIVALMAGVNGDEQTIFDGLWEFAADHVSSYDPRHMAWEVYADGTQRTSSAFDGDADIAYGLLLADRQWGSGGRINYLFEAGQVIAGIMSSDIGPQSLLPMWGDGIDPNGAIYNQYLHRTSDFMPAHFRTFGWENEAIPTSVCNRGT